MVRQKDVDFNHFFPIPVLLIHLDNGPGCCPLRSGNDCVCSGTSECMNSVLWFGRDKELVNELDVSGASPRISKRDEESQSTLRNAWLFSPWFVL